MENHTFSPMPIEALQGQEVLARGWVLFQKRNIVEFNLSPNE